MAIPRPRPTTISFLLVTAWLVFAQQRVQRRNLFLATSRSSFFARASTPPRKSSSPRKERPSSASAEGCFVGSSLGCSHERHQRRMELSSASTPQTTAPSENRSSRSIFADANERSEFDLQKARLMARFSSVAYADPPKMGGMAGVEYFVDEYGVSIARPIRPCDDCSQTAGRDLEGGGPGENNAKWNMAHCDAMAPRPLALMLSGCDAPGTSEGEGMPFGNARFRWVALATNRNTSAQFDAWRISFAGDAAAGGADDGRKSALVIAFRGTRTSSYLDLLTDIQLKQDMISCGDFGICADEGCGLSGDDGDDGGALMAHSGFLRAYSSVRASLLRLLSDVAGADDEVWFTGHSLGAALATLAVVDAGLIAESVAGGGSGSAAPEPTGPSSPPGGRTPVLPVLPGPGLSAYVFGTPRVGNRAFSDALARLQRAPAPVVREYYRVNTPGDAVVFLPRGEAANRLGIDYVHAGASVFLPALPSDEEGKTEESGEGCGRRTTRLREEAIERINRRAFGGDGDDDGDGDDGRLARIRVYPEGDRPPDPLSEIDPGYVGFFPFDPRTWTSSAPFRNFLLGEAVRSFRVLREVFVGSHQLARYEEALCLASQGDVLVVDPLP